MRSKLAMHGMRQSQWSRPIRLPGRAQERSGELGGLFVGFEKCAAIATSLEMPFEGSAFAQTEVCTEIVGDESDFVAATQVRLNIKTMSARNIWLLAGAAVRPPFSVARVRANGCAS
jgi:hypothetical protein